MLGQTNSSKETDLAPVENRLSTAESKISIVQQQIAILQEDLLGYSVVFTSSSSSNNASYDSYTFSCNGQSVSATGRSSGIDAKTLAIQAPGGTAAILSLSNSSTRMKVYVNNSMVGELNSYTFYIQANTEIKFYPTSYPDGNVCYITY